MKREGERERGGDDHKANEAKAMEAVVVVRVRPAVADDADDARSHTHSLRFSLCQSAS